MLRLKGLLLLLGLAALSAGNAQEMSRKTRSTKDFEHLSVCGGFKVFLREGSSPEVVVLGSEHEQEGVTVEVVSGRLRICSPNPGWSSAQTEVYVTSTSGLKSIEIEGAVELRTSNTLSAPDFRIGCSGASRLVLLASMENLELDCSGSASVVLKGRNKSLVGEMSGASQLDAANLQSLRATMTLSGASNAKMRVTQKIDARLSGASLLELIGQPEETVKETSGAAELRFL